jgi:hypothetical protein
MVLKEGRKSEGAAMSGGEKKRIGREWMKVDNNINHTESRKKASKMCCWYFAFSVVKEGPLSPFR